MICKRRMSCVKITYTRDTAITRDWFQAISVALWNGITIVDMLYSNTVADLGEASMDTIGELTVLPKTHIWWRGGWLSPNTNTTELITYKQNSAKGAWQLKIEKAPSLNSHLCCYCFIPRFWTVLSWFIPCLLPLYNILYYLYYFARCTVVRLFRYVSYRNPWYRCGVVCIFILQERLHIIVPALYIVTVLIDVLYISAPNYIRWYFISYFTTLWSAEQISWFKYEDTGKQANTVAMSRNFHSRRRTRACERWAEISTAPLTCSADDSRVSKSFSDVYDSVCVSAR